MHRKRILVPMGADTRNLKGVHYALALASRIASQIYIIREKQQTGRENQNSWLLNEALQELLENARQSGITFSIYEVNNGFVDEIVKIVQAEHIELLVFTLDDETSAKVINRIKPRISSQIIQVRDKER